MICFWKVLLLIRITRHGTRPAPSMTKLDLRSGLMACQ
jgi:hypothetical protein